MILEKIIRKRRIQPLLLEPITIIYITSIGMLGIFIYVILNTPIPITPSILLLMTSVYLIGVLLNANHMFHISYPEVKPSDLLKEIKRNAIDFKDLEITVFVIWIHIPNV